MNKFPIGKQSVKAIFLTLLENVTIVPSCFSFWTWVERSIFPLSRYANTLGTDSVPMEPPFAVPTEDTCFYGKENSRFRYTAIARYQPDNDKKKQGNVKIGVRRSSSRMYANEKAFLYLSEGIATPGPQRMHVR